MRPLPLVAAALLTATLLAAPTAQAAVETCQGRPATIVGAPGQLGVTGTEGPDVVVTNGAVGVATLGGDDLVCVTDVTAPVFVTLRAGAGNDVVDASASASTIDAELGTGADHYTASAGRDHVVLGSNDGGGPVDLDADTVVATTGTRPGQSADQYFTGMLDVPNPDVLQLAGDGHVVYWYGIQAPGSRVALGTSAELRPALGVGDVAIDAARRSWTEDGAPVLSWTGEVARFELGPGAPRSLSLTGSERDEYARFFLNRGARTVLRFALGGGDDTLLAPNGLAWRGSEYVGGPGEDSIDLWAGRLLDLDLAKGRLENRFFGRTQRSGFRGWDDVRVGAKRMTVLGTKKADDVRFYACTATIRGRAGKDSLESDRTGDDGNLLDCDARRSEIRIHGDGGNDTISGSRGKDLLVGGPGRDTINGKANRDRCSGEKLKSCEVRLR
jgi:Ca2+-binding RTX toxin-like protein